MKRWYVALMCGFTFAAALVLGGAANAQSPGCSRSGTAESQAGDKLFVSLQTDSSLVERPAYAFFTSHDAPGPHVALLALYRVSRKGVGVMTALRLGVYGDFTGAAHFTSGVLTATVGTRTLQIQPPYPHLMPIPIGDLTIADLNRPSNDQPVGGAEMLAAVARGETLHVAIEAADGERLYQTDLRAPGPDELDDLARKALAQAEANKKSVCPGAIPPPIAIPPKKAEGAFQPILHTADADVFEIVDASFATGSYRAEKLLKLYKTDQVFSGRSIAHAEISLAISCKNMKYSVSSSLVFNRNDDIVGFIRPSDFVRLLPSDEAAAVLTRVCSSTSTGELLTDRTSALNFTYGQRPVRAEP